MQGIGRSWGIIGGGNLYLSYIINSARKTPLARGKCRRAGKYSRKGGASRLWIIRHISPRLFSIWAGCIASVPLSCYQRQRLSRRRALQQINIGGTDGVFRRCFSAEIFRSLFQRCFPAFVSFPRAHEKARDFHRFFLPIFSQKISLYKLAACTGIYFYNSVFSLSCLPFSRSIRSRTACKIYPCKL